MMQWGIRVALALLLGAPLAGAQTFTIPDNTSGSIVSTDQAIWMQADIDTLTAGVGSVGVLTGLLVTPQSVPNMTLAVSAGSLWNGTTAVAVAAGTMTITTAHATLPRMDLVVVDSAGVKSVVTGAAAASPGQPALPAGSVGLAAVYVPAATTAIAAANLVAKRVIVRPEGALNVLTYGAVPDSTFDSTTAIQAAIDAAQAGFGKGVYFPPGTGCYRISAPLLVVGENPVRLYGDWRALSHGSCLVNDLTYAPLIIMGGTVPPTPQTFTTALVGTGSALVADGGVHTTTNYTDAGAPTRLNGLSQFSMEGFFRTTGLASGNFYQYVCESSGTITGTTARTAAFYVKLSNDGRLRGAVNVGGSTTEIYTAAGVIVDSTVYQFELSYDATTVRLFYGIPGATSTLVGTVTVSGLVQQGDFEDMGCASGTRFQFPHGAPADSGINGAIDSLRMSNVARHTSTYTVPTVKYTADGQTLLLQNFDNETDYVSVAQTGASNVVYLPKRGSGYTQVAHAEVDHLSFQGVGAGAILLTGVIDSSFHDLNFYGGMQYGLDCFSDCYLDRIERISSLYVRFPIMLPSQAGPNELCNLTSTGAIVGILWGFGSGTLCNIYNTGSSIQWAVILRTGTWNVHGGGVSTEDASGAVFKGAFYLEHLQATTFTGIGIESIQNDVPLVSIDAGDGITFVGSRFNSKATTTKIFDILNAPTTPVYVLNSMKDQAAVPWATDSAVRLLPESQRAAPTITGFGSGATVGARSSADVLWITAGSGGATGGTVTIPDPPAPTGWICEGNNQTTAAAHTGINLRQTGSTVATVTVENQVTASGAATALTAGDLLVLACRPY